MLKKFFRETLIYAGNDILSRGATLFLTPIYTRLFSPKDYGIIDTMAMLAALASLIIPCQISQGMARYYSDADSQDKIRYASTALWFTALTYTIFAFAGILLAPRLSRQLLGSSEFHLLFVIAVLSISVSGIFYSLQGQLRWQIKSTGYALSNTLRVVSSACLTILLVIGFHWKVNSVFLGMLGGGIMGSALALFFSRGTYQFAFDWNKCKQMLHFSAPLALSGLSIFAFSFGDRLAIKQLMTLDALGIFGIGCRFATLIILIMSGFQNALTPLVYKNYQDKGTPNQINRILKYLFALILPLILILSIFSQEALKVFATSKYLGASPVIPLLLFGVLFANLTFFASGLFIAKKTDIITGITIIGGFLNLLLSFALVPHFGIMGAATATLCSALITFVLYMTGSQKFFYVPYQWKRITVSILTTAALVAVGSALGFSGNLTYYKLIAVKCILVVLEVIIMTWLLVSFSEVKRLSRRLHANP